MKKIRTKLVGTLVVSMLVIPMVMGIVQLPTGFMAIDGIPDTEADSVEEEHDKEAILEEGDGTNTSNETEDSMDENTSKINSLPRPGENIVVTKDNFLEHFTLSGNATYHQGSGTVNLTQNTASQAGSFTLGSQIDLTKSFYLTGRVNLGDKSSLNNGADGMGFGFHTGEISSIGLHGNGMGLAQLPDVIGFKLDTYHNSSPQVGIAADPSLRTMPNWLLGASAYASFVESPNGILTTDTSSMRIIEEPVANQFRDFYMMYDGSANKMEITYEGHTWRKDISDWQTANIEEASFIVSASTGGAWNSHQFAFISMEYTPKILEGNAVPQQVTLGESLATRNLHSFVKDVSYGEVLLNSTEYSVTLQEVENDIVGVGKATVVIKHNDSGVRTEIEVPLDVRWGDTILAKGAGDLSVGAYTYHPTENKITANQGTINSSAQVHSAFANRYYSVDLYNLTSATQKITDARNYVSHSVTGQMSPFNAISQFSGGTRVASTKVGDIIALTHEESQNRLRQIVNGQEQALLTTNNTSFLELTANGYQQLHFNLLEGKSNGQISKWTTNAEIDGMLGEFLTNSNFEMVTILGFSEYPDRSTVGTSVGKIVVEEQLSTGNKVQYEYEVNFEVAAVPESIEVSPTIATINTGESLQLATKILPENSVNTALKWTSSNEELATVDAEGMVFGKRRGEVEISVETTNGLTDIATIQVLNLEIPSIDPSNPSLELEEENPHEGSLAIRYASSLDFGETTVVENGQELIALPSIDQSGREIRNMITIQDIRPEAQRDGWQLQVRQIRELVGEAQIVMSPYVHESYLVGNNISVHEGDFIPNTDSQKFASASEANSNQIISFGMHNPQTDGVRLLIPPGMGAGNYQTSLQWNLITGPE